MNQTTSKSTVPVRTLFALCLSLLLGTMLRAAPSGQELAKRRTKLTGTRPAQWRVIWTESPSSKATISWSTARAGNEHFVYYGKQPKNQPDAFPNKVRARNNGEYNDADEDLYFHHAQLTDLDPSTKYYFTMVSDGTASPVFHFLTAPDTDQPFKLMIGGDSRSDPNTRRQVNHMMSRLLQQHPETLALVHGGDFVEDGDELDQWRTWMSDHELTTTSNGRVLPIIPGRGNHEAGDRLFQQVFDTPGGKNNYYALKIGTEFLLITLNTTISTAGNQATFLDNTLRKHEDVRWRVPHYHRPAFPAVKSPGGNKQDWVPIFEKHNLNLVFESDGHVIKRTPPIRNGEPNPDGVVYMGEGGLGVPQRTPKPADEDRWWLKSPGKTGSGHHVFLMAVGKNALRVQTVLLDGSIFDRTVIRPD